MTITSKTNAMYTTAQKILGYWTIKLESNGLTQFKSLSRKLASEWRMLNEPPPAQASLNASVGKPVWRAR